MFVPISSIHDGFADAQQEPASAVTTEVVAPGQSVSSAGVQPSVSNEVQQQSQSADAQVTVQGGGASSSLSQQQQQQQPLQPAKQLPASNGQAVPSNYGPDGWMWGDSGAHWGWGGPSWGAGGGWRDDRWDTWNRYRDWGGWMQAAAAGKPVPPEVAAAMAAAAAQAGMGATVANDAANVVLSSQP
jgi:hypothetical protein